MRVPRLLALGIVTCIFYVVRLNDGAAITRDNQAADQRITEAPKAQDQDEELQLEKLKAQQSGANVAVYKSQVQTVTNTNGKVDSVSEKKEQVKDAKTGKTLAEVTQETVGRQSSPNSKPEKLTKTTLDFPSRGVHRTSISRNGKTLLSQRSNENSRELLTEDYYTPIQGIQYTPADMAEYIYRTGDEDGVTSAIEELMQAGVMSQSDAISFLEEVKMDLEILRARREKNHLREMGLNGQESQEEKLAEARLREQRRQAMRTQEMYHQGIEEKRRLPTSKLEAFRRKGLTLENDVYDTKELLPVEPDVDYEDVVERLRLADFLSKEFSLEEIIYQLARQMFAQSVLRGNNDAEDALQRFSLFLQQEAARGRISPELQRKVIDVMLAALVDTIGEHPELMALQPGLAVQNYRNSQGNGQEKLKHEASKQELLNRKSENQEQRTLDKNFKPKPLSNTNVNEKNDATKKA